MVGVVIWACAGKEEFAPMCCQALDKMYHDLMEFYLP
jgi:hypothetical protein